MCRELIWETTDKMVSRSVLLNDEAEAEKLSSADLRRGPAVVCAAVQTDVDSQSPTDRVETSIQVPSPPPSLGGTVSSMTVQPQPVEDHSSTGGHVHVIAPAQPPPPPSPGHGAPPPPPPPPLSPGLAPPSSPTTNKTPKPKKKMKTVNWTKVSPAVASSKFLCC